MTLAPFEIWKQRKLSEYADRPVLFEDVTNEKWMLLSRERKVPTGAVYVACLGIVYGPPARMTIEGAVR